MLTALPGRIRALGSIVLIIVLASLSPVMAKEPYRHAEPLEIVTHKGVSHFTVEIADTEAARERGLMYRRRLADDHGMLFDFKTPQPVSFWMKNTLISLDMIFIDENGQVVSVARNATPLSETPIPSEGSVLGVLEIRGGRAAEIGVQPGDRVRERIFRH